MPLALDHPRPEIYVNIQGDEPLLKPEHVAALLAPFRPRRACGGAPRLSTRLRTRDDIHQSKCSQGCQRHQMVGPCTSAEGSNPATTATRPACNAHLLEAPRLVRLPQAPPWSRFASRSKPGRLEQNLRSLEQLRLLENGIALYVEARRGRLPVGVDTEADIRTAWKRCSANALRRSKS